MTLSCVHRLSDTVAVAARSTLHDAFTATDENIKMLSSVLHRVLGAVCIFKFNGLHSQCLPGYPSLDNYALLNSRL